MGTVTPLRKSIVRRSPPGRRPNAELRTREHLTAAEVDRLIEAARQNRYGHRDATMILIAFRHGLRASELVDLRLGIKFTSIRRPCTSGGSNPARRRRIRCLGWKCGPCASCNVNPKRRHLCSFQNVKLRSRPRDLPGCSSAPRPWPASRSRCIRTCCATPVALPSPTTASIPGRCRPTSGIRTSSTRFATPSSRRRGLKDSGKTETPRDARW
jgi:hypothetical protein